jgi:uncharacterized protein YdeI (BOF family)
MLPLSAVAQDKAPAKDAGMSYTGCFNKGADADHYVLVDDASGKKIVVTGDAKMLAGHANNHKVTITGMMGKEKTMDVFQASALKMVAMCK